MAVAEASKEAALREQVADLKLKVNHYSGLSDKLSKDLGAALKECESKDALEDENLALSASLAAEQARVKNLEASLAAAQAKLDKAESVLEAGKQIKAGLALLG